MSYYKCKNCNYETSRFPDIRIHLSKPHFCKTEFNNYCFRSIDHKIILSLIPHNKNGIQDIDINKLKDYNDNIKNNREKLISKLCQNKKCCLFCNKEFNKIKDLREHILIDCFYDELMAKNTSSNITNDNSTTIINDNSTTVINDNSKIIINDNSTNITTNITNIINNNIIINIGESVVSFDKSWDISDLNEYHKKFDILCSDILYSKLLQKILENKKNLNVIIDKESKDGFVYKNEDDKYVNMKLNDIINTSMLKLRDNLLEMNSSFNSKKHDDQYDMKDFIKINEEKIKKKYSDFKEKSEIKNLVSTKFTQIFNDKKDESIDIAKQFINN
jgi:hypothetical protein